MRPVTIADYHAQYGKNAAEMCDTPRSSDLACLWTWSAKALVYRQLTYQKPLNRHFSYGFTAKGMRTRLTLIKLSSLTTLKKAKTLTQASTWACIPILFLQQTYCFTTQIRTCGTRSKTARRDNCGHRTIHKSQLRRRSLVFPKRNFWELWHHHRYRWP